MKLTVGQKKALAALLPYCGSTPNDKDIEWYFRYTDKGEAPPPFEPGLSRYQALVWAHATIHGKSRVTEEIWLEGHFSRDFPLGLVIGYFVLDTLEGRCKAQYNTGLFDQAVKLWLEIHGLKKLEKDAAIMWWLDVPRRRLVEILKRRAEEVK